ncbi:MAG TPA: phosphatase PAP2 family protein [Candidatus Nanopelagicales bacterium]|nr:phosphatase PAP2 family protein [Candidatus Nanopelagicales bacterium]
MTAAVDGVPRTADHEHAHGVPWARIGVLVACGLVLAMVLVGIGKLIASMPKDNAYLVWERGVSTWFVSIRTPTLDTATHIGSYLAETITCIALLIIAMGVARWRLGRWYESWVIAAAIVGELWVFLIVTFLVDRARPGVPHLDAAPPTSSFPSGHTGAAVALYGCIAVILWRTTQRGTWVRVLVGVCCLVPLIVAVSRVYRGMHYVSDVVFGAIGGGTWLLIVLTVLLWSTRPGQRPVEAHDDEVPVVEAGPSAA